jgi:ABC-type multidrug transport system fused ATPase/permease subunit
MTLGTLIAFLANSASTGRSATSPTGTRRYSRRWRLQSASSACWTREEIVDPLSQPPDGSEGQIIPRRLFATTRELGVEGRFVLEPGEKVAIGRDGRGKSTMTLNRFYDVQRGQIMVDDVAITDIRGASCAGVGLVPGRLHLYGHGQRTYACATRSLIRAG